MKRWLFILIIVLLLLLPLAWYLASPLFVDKIANEESPSEINNESNILYGGTFSGADSFHKVEGNAIVLSDKEKKYLRFENFKSTNGPDLKVYLSEDLEGKSYISLGDLKGNIGDQNYELSSDIELEKYNHILIWCERFGVLFGQSELNKQ